MSTILGVVDYVVIGLMLFISASIGLFIRFTGGRQKTTVEFLMGGKSMSIWPVAFSLMATTMSAISILGIPAEIYMYGAQLAVGNLGFFIGALLAAYLFLPVFFDLEVSTVYEYLERRFGKTTRTISSLLFTLQMFFYVAAVLYAPSIALNAVTGLSLWTSIISLTIVCTFYCSLGGLKAVLWTDVFQSILMYITILALAVNGIIQQGGIERVLSINAEGGRLEFFNISPDFTERYTLWNTVISGVVFSFHLFGTNQGQVQRLLSVKNSKKSQMALMASLLLILFYSVLCLFDGFVIYSYFNDCDPLQNPREKISSPDQLVPHTLLKMFKHIPGLPGLCIAGIFSASLSSVSSALNSVTAVTIEDFIRPFCSCKRLTDSWAAFLSKILAIIYGAVCLLLTYIVANYRGILEATGVMFGMIGGPMLGIYSLGMFTTTANEPGILIGLLIGFVVNAWLGFGSWAAKVKVPSLPRSIEACTAIIGNATVFSTTETLVFDNTTHALNLSNERYVLTAYKISYVWFSVISVLVTLTVGYIASFLVGIWKKYPPTNPLNYSPLVRKWYFGSSGEQVLDKTHQDVKMMLKSAV